MPTLSPFLALGPGSMMPHGGLGMQLTSGPLSRRCILLQQGHFYAHATSFSDTPKAGSPGRTILSWFLHRVSAVLQPLCAAPDTGLRST